MSKQNQVLNLDKLTRKELDKELLKGIDDIDAGHTVSVSEVRFELKERHAAYLQNHSIQTSAA